jgi:hypothetical protein
MFFMDYVRHPELIGKLHTVLLEHGIDQVFISEEKCPKPYAQVVSQLDQYRRQALRKQAHPSFDKNWFVVVMCLLLLFFMQR